MTSVYPAWNCTSTHDPGNTLVILLMKQIIHQLILGKPPSINWIYVFFLIIMIVTVSFLYISKLFCLGFFPPKFRRSFQKAPDYEGVCEAEHGDMEFRGWSICRRSSFVFFFEMGGGGKYCLNDIRYITFAKTNEPQRTVT